jgi:serralysin
MILLRLACRHWLSTGESGKDPFVFNLEPSTAGAYTILNFSMRDDTIHLKNRSFTKMGGHGTLKKGAFWSNSTGKAHDASNRIIYGKDAGKIFYDVNGAAEIARAHSRR